MIVNFQVNDKDFSITLNAYFIVKWHDDRLHVMNRNRNNKPVLKIGRRAKGLRDIYFDLCAL